MKAIIFAIWVFLSLYCGIANAEINGQWVDRFYSLTNKTLVWQTELCFKSDGTWYNTKYHSNGHWYQDGDDIYINSVPFDGFVVSSTLEMVSNKLLSGKHQHWPSDNSNISFSYAKESLTFKKSICDPEI